MRSEYIRGDNVNEHVERAWIVLNRLEKLLHNLALLFRAETQKKKKLFLFLYMAKKKIRWGEVLDAEERRKNILGNLYATVK